MKTPRRALAAVALMVFAFLYAPLVAIVVNSFNSGKIVWEGFSLRWYHSLFSNGAIGSAASNSLIVAFSSLPISLLLGTMLGTVFASLTPRQQRWLKPLVLTPVFIPDIILAIGLLLFLVCLRPFSRAFDPGFLPMIIGHVTLQIPFVTLIIKARLAELDPALVEAAQDLGATRWQIWIHLLLPLLLRSLLGAALLAFTLSIDDFVVSFFMSGPGTTTLPIFIYSSVKRGLTPELNALATLIVLVSVGAAVASQKCLRST